MVIQWFPGHMARARRVLKEGLAMVDVVVEMVDARIPISSRNPEIDKIIGNKPRIIACNKADLADAEMNKYYKRYFNEKGIKVIFTDSKTGNGVRNVLKEIENVMSEKMERQKAKGRKAMIVKAMIVGVPNVGKSSFINRITKKYSAVTGDRPGFTRNKQWLKANDNVYLLDTPGLLWPKLEDQDAAKKLAITAAIKDDILDTSLLAVYLLELLRDKYPNAIQERYKFDPKDMTGVQMLEECGKRRGCLVHGGEVDYQRASTVVLDDFRNGRLGKITLDHEVEEAGEETSD